MAGHSKWANIKHRKGAVDAKRGKIYTKLIKEIYVATKSGGASPDSNPKLRLAIQNAKGANMPKDTIEKAIKKASGEGGENYQSVVYEGTAPNGVAVIVECMTDNINRTVSSLRSIFTKHGGNLGKNGSVSYLFDRKGVFKISLNDFSKNEDEFTLYMIDAGVEEIDKEDDEVYLTCSIDRFGDVQKKLEDMGVESLSANIESIPNNFVILSEDQSSKSLKLIDTMEEDDDVQRVYHNISFE